MSAFIGKLRVELLDDSTQGKWGLTEPFGYQSDVAGMTFIAPIGFTTDFCSVPRIPLAFDILGDRARMSGTIHDLLYTAPHLVDRSMADQVLREMLLLEGIPHLEAMEFYLAVRAGGESHWVPDVSANPSPEQSPM